MWYGIKFPKKFASHKTLKSTCVIVELRDPPVWDKVGAPISICGILWTPKIRGILDMLHGFSPKNLNPGGLKWPMHNTATQVEAWICRYYTFRSQLATVHKALEPSVPCHLWSQIISHEVLGNVIVEYPPCKANPIDPQICTNYYVPYKVSTNDCQLQFVGTCLIDNVRTRLTWWDNYLMTNEFVMTHNSRRNGVSPFHSWDVQVGLNYLPLRTETIWVNPVVLKGYSSTQALPQLAPQLEILTQLHPPAHNNITKSFYHKY